MASFVAHLSTTSSRKGQCTFAVIRSNGRLGLRRRCRCSALTFPIGPRTRVIGSLGVAVCLYS